MKSLGIIYKAVNKINGKTYIGQTTKSLDARIKAHLHEGSYAFNNALRKYGILSFEFSVIDTASSHEILDAKEKYWIALYGSIKPHGYNLTSGGNIGKGVSEETKRKMSMANSGRVRSDAFKENVSQKMIEIRKHTSQETLRKLSEALMGHPVSEKTKQAVSHAQRGNTHRRGKQASEQSRQKMREHHGGGPKKGHVVSLETIRKILETKQRNNESLMEAQS